MCFSCLDSWIRVSRTRRWWRSPESMAYGWFGWAWADPNQAQQEHRPAACGVRSVDIEDAKACNVSTPDSWVGIRNWLRRFGMICGCSAWICLRRHFHWHGVAVQGERKRRVGRDKTLGPSSPHRISLLIWYLAWWIDLLRRSIWVSDFALSQGTAFKYWAAMPFSLVSWKCLDLLMLLMLVSPLNFPQCFNFRALLAKLLVWFLGRQTLQSQLRAPCPRSTVFSFVVMMGQVACAQWIR